MSADVIFFESVPYFSLQTPVTTSEFVLLSSSIPLPAPAPFHDVSSPVSLEHTTMPPASKPVRDFRFVYTHRQKVPTSEQVLADSSLVEGPPSQPSVPPSDHDVPIALCKGKQSCTDHPIFYFIFYDHLNLSFRQFVMPVSFISTLRSYEEAILVPA